MPNIKSAKKRVKVIATKTERNKAMSSALKTEIKKANAAIASNADNKAEQVKVAITAIDKAASKGLLHKNNAARKKSAIFVVMLIIQDFIKLLESFLIKHLNKE